MLSFPQVPQLTSKELQVCSMLCDYIVAVEKVAEEFKTLIIIGECYLINPVHQVFPAWWLHDQSGIVFQVLLYLNHATLHIKSVLEWVWLR